VRRAALVAMLAASALLAPAGAGRADARAGLRTTEPAASAVLAHFSRWAGALLAITLSTGVAQALLMTDIPRRATDTLPGGVGEVIDSTYGRTLEVKLVLVAGIVALGGFACRAVRAAAADGEPTRRASLERTLAREATLAAALLAATTVLVGVPPLSTLGNEPWTTTVAQGQLVATVTVAPARVGLADVHVVLLPPGGTLECVRAVKATLFAASDAASGGAPVGASGDSPRLVVPIDLVGPNHALGRV
jgi:putative copper export protein